MTLTTEQRAFLAAPHYAVVATIGPDGMPHQTVMWYQLDGDELVLSTPQQSLKHRHLLRDERLSVCVEDGFRYLTIIGQARLEEEPHAARAFYQQLGARYMAGMAAGPPRRPEQPDPAVARLLARARVTLRLRIERAYGQGFAPASE